MIRKATTNDCPRIAEIHVFSWRYAYKDFISMEFLINKMTVQRREKVFLELISGQNGNDETYVFEENNIIKGFMTIGNCRDDDKGKETFELEGIYIDPLFQRQKIGSKLVNLCIEEALKQEKSEITLWVFEKNINSIKFYEKTGFKMDGKIKLMELFNENAIRMCRKL